MKLYLGIDGGQSGTTALIGDENGNVLGEGHAGPCNHVGASERRDKFFAAIGDSIAQAAQAAGVAAVFEAACAGFSGGAEDKDGLTRELVRAQRYLITHDAHIALAGATAGGPGIITIAGTGSIAYGRNAEGQTVRCGGWGYLFGDEGGAFDIVRQALRAVLRHAEGWGQYTGLQAALLQATGAKDPHALMHLFYTSDYPRERIASLARVVDASAQSGDAVAAAILDQAAHALATLTAAVRRQLFRDEDTVQVHYVGGVFSSGPLLSRFQILSELDGTTRVLPPRHNPAFGALLEARRL
ncbi:MAG: BadF/BadG/BcrA/BcrD ATPase family protein [Acidobacteriota bacterium]